MRTVVIKTHRDGWKRVEEGLWVNKGKYNKKSRQSTCSIETRRDVSERERKRAKKKRIFCVIT